ncbi:MAG: hypothetical protein J6V65_04595, partial [Fibrobacterales bacterium]|nr:hypothetical protein [Fibrobacterales bacterium]
IAAGEKVSPWIREVVADLVLRDESWAYCQSRGVPAAREFLASVASARPGSVAVASDDVPTETVDEVVGLFGHVGSAMAVPESQLDAVTGLSGSGPAWVFQFVEGLAAGGVQAGLARPVAEELALATIEGSVKMLRAKMGGTGDLTAKVCSPAGTTVYGLNVLENAGFRGTLMDAVVAAAERSKELGAK